MRAIWREGARTNDPLDTCPRCGKTGLLFSSDFKAFGKQSIRICQFCARVFHNGKDVGPLEGAHGVA